MSEVVTDLRVDSIWNLQEKNLEKFAQSFCFAESVHDTDCTVYPYILLSECKLHYCSSSWTEVALLLYEVHILQLISLVSPRNVCCMRHRWLDYTSITNIETHIVFFIFILWSCWYEYVHITTTQVWFCISMHVHNQICGIQACHIIPDTSRDKTEIITSSLFMSREHILIPISGLSLFDSWT